MIVKFTTSRTCVTEYTLDIDGEVTPGTLNEFIFCHPNAEAGNTFYVSGRPAKVLEKSEDFPDDPEIVATEFVP